MLIEWPDRAAGFLPPDRLDVTLTLSPKLSPSSATSASPDTARSRRGSTAWRGAPVHRRGGFSEAAARAHPRRRVEPRYERLSLGKRAILMNSPRRPDGPPVRDGKPYSAIAHLAETSRRSLRWRTGCAQRGFSAPEILPPISQRDFSCWRISATKRVVTGDPPAPIDGALRGRGRRADRAARKQLPAVLPVAPHVNIGMPPYDIDAFLIEVELLLDWYLPRLGIDGADDARDEFSRSWREALAAGDRCAADLGAARLPFAQPAVAAASARASRGSACSISRTR